MVYDIKDVPSLIFAVMSLFALERSEVVRTSIWFSYLEKRLGGYSSFAKQYFDDENFIAQYPFILVYICNGSSFELMISLAWLLCSMQVFTRTIPYLPFH